MAVRAVIDSKINAVFLGWQQAMLKNPVEPVLIEHSLVQIKFAKYTGAQYTKVPVIRGK